MWYVHVMVLEHWISRDKPGRKHVQINTYTLFTSIQSITWLRLTILLQKCKQQNKLVLIIRLALHCRVGMYVQRNSRSGHLECQVDQHIRGEYGLGTVGSASHSLSVEQPLHASQTGVVVRAVPCHSCSNLMSNWQCVGEERRTVSRFINFADCMSVRILFVNKTICLHVQLFKLNWYFYFFKFFI